jgi:hypothetical protein
MSDRGPDFKDLSWLDFGVEHRTRFEMHDDDYTVSPPENHDNPFLMRSRVYLGVRDILDPFRVAVEFYDAREFNSRYPDDNTTTDENDFLQAYGELYFKDVFGKGAPWRFQAGRMTFDYVDRKLVGRNRWRNTVNAFDGFRTLMGTPDSDWSLDIFAAMPVERRVRQPDRSDEQRWFYGVVGAWRAWSDVITIEPYYYVLDEDRTDPNMVDREIHTLGMHVFGPIGSTGFDYDADGAWQFGDDGPREQRAFALFGEIGYTFPVDWKPRLSFSGTYATGDQDPADGVNERFDRLFVPSHPFSTGDLFTWQNTVSPKIRLECTPQKALRLMTAYGGYWLASDNDSWPLTGSRDPDGGSGRFVGQELELVARYQLNERTELEAGYSYFIPGGFVENTTPTADDSNFFYVSVTFSF